jgi:sigma-B regulation protein RsbU (phosphoserine phosphatase)
MRIGYQISCLVVGAAVCVTAALTLVGYQSARRQYLAGVDRQLTAAAAGLPRIIGDDYFTRALAGPADAVPKDEYDVLVRTLNDLADRSGVYYVYAFARDGDGKRIVNLATSASLAERAADDWAAFREPYQEPPDSLIQTLADGQTRFAEYTDEFGSFRSIFVRHVTPGGAPFVVGVDVSLGEIRRDLAAMVWRYLLAGGGVALLAAAAGVWIARRIAEPLRVLASEVEAWARRDFARDDALRRRLESLATRGRCGECGELARSFVGVQDRLASYLAELTAATAAKQKIESQLEVAKDIQEGLLPPTAPRIDHFEVVGWSKPADQTGGDYFDWLELPNGHVVLTIGDVTGHGIGPALVTAASRAYARATFNAEEALDKTIAKLNELLHGDLKGDRFVTLVACLLDPPARQLQLVAAGHGPLIFYSSRRDAVDVTIDSQGVPLGIMHPARYDKAVELDFEPGDVLVLVSDGFFEWMNAAGETFGIDRLSASIFASCRTAPDQIIDRLRADVERFHGGTGQADDTTALIIRCVS